MRDVYTLPEYQTGRRIPGGKHIRSRLKLNWQLSSIDPNGLDTSDFMVGERIIEWKGTPDSRPMGRVLSIDEHGNMEVVIYFDALEDATFEPTTVPKVTEQQGNRRITREALLVGGHRVETLLAGCYGESSDLECPTGARVALGAGCASNAPGVCRSGARARECRARRARGTRRWQRRAASATGKEAKGEAHEIEAGEANRDCARGRRLARSRRLRGCPWHRRARLRRGGARDPAAGAAALEAKLASGVRRVEQGDQGTEYQTTAQLLTAIAYLKREIAQAAGTAVHSRLSATSKGT